MNVPTSTWHCCAKSYVESAWGSWVRSQVLCVYCILSSTIGGSLFALAMCGWLDYQMWYINAVCAGSAVLKSMNRSITVFYCVLPPCYAVVFMLIRRRHRDPRPVWEFNSEATGAVLHFVRIYKKHCCWNLLTSNNCCFHLYNIAYSDTLHTWESNQHYYCHSKIFLMGLLTFQIPSAVFLFLFLEGRRHFCRISAIHGYSRL